MSWLGDRILREGGRLKLMKSCFRSAAWMLECRKDMIISKEFPTNFSREAKIFQWLQENRAEKVFKKFSWKIICWLLKNHRLSTPSDMKKWFLISYAPTWKTGQILRTKIGNYNSKIYQWLGRKLLLPSQKCFREGNCPSSPVGRPAHDGTLLQFGHVRVP